MVSNTIQCGFESHPGHFAFDSKIANGKRMSTFS